MYFAGFCIVGANPAPNTLWIGVMLNSPPPSHQLPCAMARASNPSSIVGSASAIAVPAQPIQGGVPGSKSLLVGAMPLQAVAMPRAPGPEPTTSGAMAPAPRAIPFAPGVTPPTPSEMPLYPRSISPADGAMPLPSRAVPPDSRAGPLPLGATPLAC